MSKRVEHIPSYIHTYTGLLVDPLDLQEQDVCIEDIAHALGNQCRFSGHTRSFYSVAQHAVHVSRLVPSDFALDGLLHDASETYLQDMARPLKMSPRLGQAYRGAEDRAQRVICEVFGLRWPEPKEVKEADNVVLVTEARDLMWGTESWKYYREVEPLPDVILPWGPIRARTEFLRRYHLLTRVEK